MTQTKTVTTKQEVVDILQENLDEFVKFKVGRVGLFGSFVREEQTENSDVDILVELIDPDFYNYCNLIDFIEELFPGRKVDVVSEGGLNHASGVNIFKEVEYLTDRS